MCNRYRVSPGDWAKLRMQGIVPPFPPDESWPVPCDPFAQLELFPKKLAPVIRLEDGALRANVMTWGWPLQVRGASGKMLDKPVTNVRNLSSPMWRNAIANPVQRCLVPVSAFSEYGQVRGADGKLGLHWFELVDRPIFTFAGIWRMTPAGPVYAFLTCEPNPLVGAVHPKAMPVILHEEDQARWLDVPLADALALVAPFPSQLMREAG